MCYPRHGMENRRRSDKEPTLFLLEGISPLTAHPGLGGCFVFCSYTVCAIAARVCIRTCWWDDRLRFVGARACPHPGAVAVSSLSGLVFCRCAPTGPVRARASQVQVASCVQRRFTGFCVVPRPVIRSAVSGRGEYARIRLMPISVALRC